ncbi:hypothetical protein DID88_009014 [Monilinia fructigena]|uniref:Uncharacterized protein n=1 Tax=Monilinia fructigena TaxID=38457 RepID=A0A395IF50_9HELO|nr:hypothetical protein DID88_009014 [Monilinia fructigena]
MSFKLPRNLYLTAETMELISPISIILYFSLFSSYASGGANLIPQRRAVNGLTILDASNCASPSCTITPTALTSITITPSPVTVLHPPGAITPVVLTLDPITIASFQPKPTVLANNGDGILTLGTATLSSFKATATTSYLVLPSDAEPDEKLELNVAVVANVEAEAQLFFAFNSDKQGICDLFPGAGISDRSIEKFHNSRSLRRGLMKRHALLLDVSDSDKTWVEDAIEDSKTVLSATATRLTALKNDDDTFMKVPEKGLNDYWHKDELLRLLLMVNAQIAALEGPDEVVFTSFDQNTDQRTLACSSDDDENKLDQYGSTKYTLKFPLLTKDGELKDCKIQGFTCFCPLAINQNNPLPAQNDQEFCTPENENLLTKRYWDFNKSPGSRVQITLGEYSGREDQFRKYMGFHALL